MENASKALIIAGAILLAILIISLGIMIYNQASGVVNNNSMTEVQVTSFNGKFDQYLGDKIRGANVNALVSAVNTNNMSTDDSTEQITLKGDSAITDGATASAGNYKKGAKSGSTYKVEATDYTEGGLISEITITENSGS